MNKDTDFFEIVPGKHAAGILSPSSNMKRWNLFLQNTFETTLREYIVCEIIYKTNASTGGGECATSGRGSDFPVRTQKFGENL